MKREEKREEAKKEVWFPVKKYGVGWGPPVTWQGWAVMLGYILLVMAGVFIRLRSSADHIWFFPYIMTLTILFVFICWTKGEKVHWHWGGRK